MRRSAKITIAAMLVATGLAGAMLFRDPSVPTESDSTDPADQVALRHPGASGEHSVQLDDGASRRLIDDDVSLFKDAERPPAAKLKKQTPPNLARHYHDQLAQSGIPVGRTSNVKGEARHSFSDSQIDEREMPRKRLHKLVDGDTLKILAKRYLGDAGRYGEIYGANLGVLADPDLLPIGTVLTIPTTSKGDGNLADPSPSSMERGIHTREVSLDEGNKPIGASSQVRRYSDQLSPANLNPAAPLVPIPPGALESK